MVFRPKVDGLFITLFIIYTLFVTAVTALPFILNLPASIFEMLILPLIFIICEGFIIWFFLSLKYVLYPDYLHVRGGPFSSKIKYSDITKIQETNNIIAGYRMLTAKDGIQIYYRTASIGSVKISPKDKNLFIQELEKRSKHL